MVNLDSVDDPQSSADADRDARRQQRREWGEVRRLEIQARVCWLLGNLKIDNRTEPRDVSFMANELHPIN